MSQSLPSSGVPEAWRDEVRALEDAACNAFLAADLETLDRLWSDAFIVNSPLNVVIGKTRLFDLLRTGRIHHSAYAFEIEHMSRHGDIAVVMGRDTVTDPPDGKVSQRRYTNVWRRESGAWRTIARHANVVAGTTPT